MGENPGRTRLERETNIIWNDAEPMASIWTFSPKEQRRLRKLGYEAATPQGPYFVPKNLFTIRRPRAKKAISRERLEALRNGRLAAMRARLGGVNQ